MEKKIYLVGGAVRDKLLNIKNSDKDYVAVGYNESDFQDLKKVGKSFPVFLMDNGDELALARIDNKISSGYNGFEVCTKNVTLEEDLARRDLTINAIAYDEKNNIYIDPFNGKDDIKNKILRHTTKAFCEDPLRVLRIARFKAKLGKDWSIDNETKKIIFNMKNELVYLQKERVYKEIEKVLKLENSHIFFEILIDINILDILFPTIYKLRKSIDKLKVIKKESILLKLIVVYHNIKKDEIIDVDIPKKLKNNMLFIIDNYKKLNSLTNLTDDEIIIFFKKFRKNKIILKEMITFCKLKELNINEDNLINLFNEISNFSPSKWMNSQNIKPSIQEIKEYIYKENINIVRKYLY